MSPDKRHKFITDRIRYWRKRLGIDEGISISIKYVTQDDESHERVYASVDTSMLEYGRATVKIYDEVFASQNFAQLADESVCHEMVHLALHPLVAYCWSMFQGDEGKRAELERLEELVTTRFERTLTKRK